MEDRYEGNLEEHINLICEKCKKILDYNVPITIDPKRVLKKTGFSITDTRLEYHGLCRECREEEGFRRFRHINSHFP
jgi:Fur family transcriptional regulator, peroxide stress response regulator